MVTVKKILSSTTKMSLLKVSEVFCYICRSILIEPVTLPCDHVFCFSCFEHSMQETSYSCPLCRKRISNWVRSVKKSNNLVNQKLWTQIKDQYENEVKLKLNGEDDGLDQYMQKEYSATASTSKPGEVAQEFSKFLCDFRNEIDKLKEAEEQASKEYIMKLKEEEERQLQILQENNLSRLKEDSKLAMKIQEEINKDTSSPKSIETSRRINLRSKKSSKKNVERAVKGPMDDFLKGLYDVKSIKENSFFEKPKEERSTSTDSTDSIRLEMNLFKPIKTAHTTPPKQYPDGRYNEIRLTKVTPLKLTFNNLEPSSSSTNIIEGKNIHSTPSAFVDTNTVSVDIQEDFESPSKRLRFTTDDIENNVLKDITLGENAEPPPSTIAQIDSVKKKSNSHKKSSLESSSIGCKIPKIGFDSHVQGKGKNETEQFETQDYIDFDPSIEDKIIEEQRKIENMILQEKEDRELALKLSREWESELNKKPLTRSMRAAAVKNTRNISDRSQQTLMESIASSTKKRK